MNRSTILLSTLLLASPATAAEPAPASPPSVEPGLVAATNPPAATLQETNTPAHPEPVATEGPNPPGPSVTSELTNSPPDPTITGITETNVLAQMETVESTNSEPDEVIAPPPPPPPSITVEEVVAATQESLAPTVDALSTRLNAIEQTLIAQHQATVTASQDTTRTILLVAGSFATALLLGVLLSALILSRAVQRMSDVVIAALPAPRPMNALPQGAEEGTSALELGSHAPVEQVTQRFVGAMERLEKRIVDLEHTAHHDEPHETSSHSDNGATPHSGGNGGTLEFSVSALSQKQYGTPTPDTDSQTQDPAASWLGKGQALLNLDRAQEALDCFNQALEQSPASPADIYIKRGMALEKMENMEDAMESYDQAIATDATLTLAYLCKGAVCNRLQRYREALDCYESALRCEEKLATG